MNLIPFVQLPAPRETNRPELPPDLAEFYAWHEGVGLEGSWHEGVGPVSSPGRTVRLGRLDEVALIGWKDLHLASADKVPEGWEEFAAFRIGMGRFFEEILYIL